MKICPICNQTYTDQTLNFCLNDGSVLNQINDDSFNQQTVIMAQAPNTNKNTFPVQPASSTNWGTSQPTFVTPPSKKSKAWIWIVGIFGVIALGGIVGFIALVALVANIPDDDTNNNNRPVSTSSPTQKYDLQIKDDFSKWSKFSNSDGSGEFNNGEYKLQSRQSNFFYVLISPNKAFKTSNASTTVTVRNVTGVETNLGHGIVVHGDSKDILSRDYAFLIDASKQSYRVVKHLENKEIVDVGWTKFPAIRSGTQTNELQVKDENGKMSFFINGQFATNVTDSIGYKEGIVGIYAGDGVQIAFSNLQLGR